MLPALGSTERPLLPSHHGQRWEHDDQREEGRHLQSLFQVKRPMSDIVARAFVVLTPLALALVAIVVGIHFQRQAAIFGRGDTSTVGAFVNPVKSNLAYMTVIAIDGLIALSIWSWLIVSNTCRVCRSIRTPWFAAIGWMVAPGLGYLAHITLDQHLEAGSLIGFTVFLGVLYVPFGTLGGASHDLGGSMHLARTWFLASVISAFLLIVGMSGATKGLPIGDAERTLWIRAFACYLASMMLVASSALAYATGRALNAQISHQWTKFNDPENLFGKHRIKITRSGRKLHRRLTPTLFLRVIVTIGLLGTGVASVCVMLWLRGRALLLDGRLEAGERRDLLDAYRQTSIKIGIVALAVHAAYMTWAVVAARNAHRRSIMAPTPWAVFSAFVIGPVVSALGFEFGGPFGAAVLTIGVIMTIGGFVVAQLVLGRTANSLGGQGRVFLVWVIADFAMGLFTAFVAGRSDQRWEVVAYGVVQTGLTLVATYCAWTSMSRLDRTTRAYYHSGSVEALEALPGHSLPTPSSHDAAKPNQDASLALTSSQS